MYTYRDLRASFGGDIYIYTHVHIHVHIHIRISLYLYIFIYIQGLPRVFRWRHQRTQTEVVLMVEEGYGSIVRVGYVALLLALLLALLRKDTALSSASVTCHLPKPITHYYMCHIYYCICPHTTINVSYFYNVCVCACVCVCV